MQHFYRLYENKRELVKIAALFFKEGLKKREHCFWIVPNVFDKNDAVGDLKYYIESIDSYIEKGQFRILKFSEWHNFPGNFDIDLMLKKWESLYNEVTSKGFSGLRLVGNPCWDNEEHWKVIVRYEARFNDIIKNYKFTALCTYNINNLKSIIYISDVIHNHEDCFVGG